MTDHTKLYAQGHLAAAHTGEAAFKAAAERYRETEWATELARLHEDIAEDRRRLEEIASHLGAEVGSVVHRVSQAVLSALGNATRLVHTRGELGRITEVEKLRDAVAGKLAGWELLLVASATDERLSRADLEELISRAKDQTERLRTIHLGMAQHLFDQAGLGASGVGDGTPDGSAK